MVPFNGPAKVKFEVADAEALSFADRSFDVVLSTFGVIFTPNHAAAASGLVIPGNTWRP